MRNRISQYISDTSTTATTLCQRPTLDLKADRPITVDMERFFEFSFSFAEALMDLEDKYIPERPIVSLQRELALKEAIEKADSFDLDLDLEIDARWM